jgi:hypothetical protein
MFADEMDRTDPDVVDTRYKELLERLGIEVGMAPADGRDR